jgi:hypothetical protein
VQVAAAPGARRATSVADRCREVVAVETVTGLPALEAGSHARPEQGACLLEYVSVLAGERFCDRPRCVDRRLASLARAVNDALDDTARPQLARLAPALIGTAIPSSGRARRWRARISEWLLSSPCSEVFAEIELQRRVKGLAEAVLTATGSQTTRDTTLIEVLAEAVAAHRATHQLPPVTTTDPLPGHPGTPSASTAAPRR